jgi:MFS family permease
VAVAIERPRGRFGRWVLGKRPALLRTASFRRYWGAQTVSMFGDQVSSVAVPLTAVIALKAGPVEMGSLTALLWLPSLLFGIHAGAWVDRRGRRRATMIVADIARFALLATVPIAYAIGMLSLTQLYVVAFAAGLFSVLFSVADTTLFVSLVRSDEYVEANSLVHASRALSFVAGPSLGGLLVQVLSAPFAVAADALSFLGSAAFLGRTTVVEPPPAEGEDVALTAGVKFIARSAIVRAGLCAAATINLFTFAFIALFMLYAVRKLHVQPGVLGVVLGAGAVGGVLGAAATRRLSSAIGVGRTCVLGCILFTSPLLVVPLAAGAKPLILATLFLAEFVSGIGVVILDISISSILAAVTPDALRARVTGAFQAINYGTRPAGALAAGALATLIGLRTTLWLAAAGATLGFLWLLPSPLPHFRISENRTLTECV